MKIKKRKPRSDAPPAMREVASLLVNSILSQITEDDSLSCYTASDVVDGVGVKLELTNDNNDGALLCHIDKTYPDTVSSFSAIDRDRFWSIVDWISTQQGIINVASHINKQINETRSWD